MYLKVKNNKMTFQKTRLIFHTDSLYQSVQSHINYSASAEEWRPWTEPSDFAAGVVANALKKKPKVWYWRGTKTFITWLAVTFLPYGFLVRIQLSGFVSVDWELIPVGEQDSKWLHMSGLNTLRKTWAVQDRDDCNIKPKLPNGPHELRALLERWKECILFTFNMCWYWCEHGNGTDHLQNCWFYFPQFCSASKRCLYH